MRLFIAIQLDQPMLDALAELQGAMHLCGMRGSYSREENLHVTLAFIGEYPDAQEVLDALETVHFEPFDICLEGAGHFGDLWWAGLSGPDALYGLAKKVRRALADAGIPFDRKRFMPHITLVRRAVWNDRALRQLEHPAAKMIVTSFSLMRSERGKNGMIYTELGTIFAD